ncbi:hypothetical protein XELAEV_18029294mg [Xenopus laevis]|uniref:Uncharacterized protein n=1 Tax=Xenopus laevis TaxID=8355 RepID=A0A974CRQ8_XENLA|nr:hypothetical protein XELAEV_18029294mg [Xenopus laevis]
MVLGTTHKQHMIPAPPAVSSFHQRFLRFIQNMVLLNSFKPLGRPCIPFHSIPQTANAGVCRLPGTNRMESNEAFIVRLKCAHVYAAIFPSISHPLTAVPYRTIFPPLRFP